MTVRAGWPHRGPGGLQIWLDRMRAYVDSRLTDDRRRGKPVDLQVLAPATPVGKCTVTRNPDGSATLTGHLDLNGPIEGGTPVIFARMPAGYGVADAVSLAAHALLTDGPLGPVLITVDLNPGDDAAMFVVGPQVPDGQTLMVTLDGVNFWPAAASRTTDQ